MITAEIISPTEPEFINDLYFVLTFKTSPLFMMHIWLKINIITYIAQ